MWLLLAFGSALFAGLTAILSKLGLQKVDSTLATAIRTAVVFLFAWLLVWMTGSYEELRNLQGRTLIFLFFSGLSTGLSWLFYFRALQTGPVSKVAAVDKSSTILTVLLGVALLGERLTVLGGFGLVLLAGGTWLMLEWKSEPSRQKASGAKSNSGWFLYAALSVVFASLTSILSKIGIQDVDSNLGTAIRTSVVLICAWAMVLLQHKQSGILSIDGRSWRFLILSGFATGFSWLCFFRALQDGPASVVIPIDKLSILVTILFAVLVLHERLSWKRWSGLGLTVAGTLLLLL